MYDVHLGGNRKLPNKAISIWCEQYAQQKLKLNLFPTKENFKWLRKTATANIYVGTKQLINILTTETLLIQIS